MVWTEKYVTATASGGGSGNSEGDAYTFSEAMTSGLAAGDVRFNIKAGSYSVTSAINQNLSGNSSINPYAMRGYTTTPGDIDGVDQRSLTAGTDMPEFVITGSGILIFDEDHSFIENLVFDSQNTSAMSFSIEDTTFLNCRWKFANARTTNCMTLGLYNKVLNCSFLLDGTTSSDAFISCGEGATFMGCDFKQINGDTDTKAVENNIRGTFSNCTFEGMGIGIYGHPALIDRCSFYNCTSSAIEYQSNTTYNAVHKMVSNCIFSSMPTGIKNGTVSVYHLTTTNNLFHSVTTPVDGFNDLVVKIGETVTSTDPFTDSANSDFSLSSSSPALASNFTSTQLPYLANIDIGAIQSQASSGGGSTNLHPLGY